MKSAAKKGSILLTMIVMALSFCTAATASSSTIEGSKTRAELKTDLAQNAPGESLFRSVKRDLKYDGFQRTVLGSPLAPSGGAVPDFFVSPSGIVSRGRSVPSHVNGHGFTLREINLVSGRSNCASCAIQTDRLLSGAGHDFADLIGVTSTRKLERHFGWSFRTGLSESQLAKQVSNIGERGIVFGNRGIDPATGKLRVGHFFNVANQKGTVRFLDGQTGTAAKLDDFTDFWFLRTN